MFRVNAMLGVAEAEEMCWVNFETPGASDPSNEILDLGIPENKWRSVKSFNEFTGITWKGFVQKQIGTKQKFHAKFIIVRYSHVLWYKAKDTKSADKWINLEKATISDVYPLCPGTKVFKVEGRNNSKKSLVIKLDCPAAFELQRIIQDYLVARSIKMGFIKGKLGPNFRNWTTFYLKSAGTEIVWNPLKKPEYIPNEIFRGLETKPQLSAIKFKDVSAKAID
jgi:hypothetical protein